ncbi:MAG: hypothetical protein R3F45_10495 [Gammaproteobacteria bacterium]
MKTNARPVTAHEPARTPWIRDVALARKLTLVLVVKLCFILAMKQLWFSEPKTDGMSMPIDAVERHLLGPPAP